MTTTTLATTQEERATCASYLAAVTRRAALDAAEDRTFASWASGRGSAATARKAKSRVNAYSYTFNAAETAVLDLMDRMSDDGRLPGVYHADPLRFAQEVTAS